MSELDILGAEAVGFDPMNLVRALPGVLQSTGQVLAPQLAPRAAAPPAAPPPPPPPPPPRQVPRVVSVGAVVLGAVVLLRLIRR